MQQITNFVLSFHLLINVTNTQNRNVKTQHDSVYMRAHAPPRKAGGSMSEIKWRLRQRIEANHSAAAAAAPGEALGARAGSVPRAHGVLGAAAWPAGAMAARRGRGLSSLCTLHALLCGCGGSRRGARGPRRGHPRAGGAPRAVVGAAARLAGAAVSPPCAPGAPSGGGAAGLAAWAAGAVSSAGAGPRVDGPVSADAAPGCPAGGPTGTAASASRRSSRSARVSPAHPGETGEREQDRRWWRWSCWGEPSESDILVILAGMRGGRCAHPTTSWCICVVPWAVLCSAPQGGGGEGRGGRRWR